MGGSTTGSEEFKRSTSQSYASAPPSPSHPLLNKPHGSETEETDSQITYNYGPRVFRDLPFLFLFVLFSLSTYVLGIFVAVNHNSNSSRISHFSYDLASNSCKYKSSLSYLTLTTSSSLSSVLVKDLIWTLVFTLIFTGPCALSLLWLLRNYTKYVVYVSLPFFIIIPIFLNVFWFSACTVSPACRDSFPLPYRIIVFAFLFLVIGLIAWIIIANRHRIELTVSVIQVGAQALANNLSLFGVFPILGAGLLLYFVPIVVFLVFAPKNGKVVPKLYSSGLHGCVWKQDRWVPAYFALAIITMIWSITTVMEAQVYVISGSIAQWYFSKQGTRRRRTIRHSLRNAFGPSFGTVCFSGMVVGAVRIIQVAVDHAKKEDASSGIVNLVLRQCANFLFSTIHFVNKFTINFAAITGEAYCCSAKMTYELLRRNLLSTVFVETISTRIFIGIIVVMSAIYAIVVCAVLRVVSSLGSDAYFVAALAFLLLILVLSFVIHVLENVIDTIYICYVIDKDRAEVSKQEVHEVYVLIPLRRYPRRHLHPARTPLVG